MQKFKKLTSVAAPLPMINIDTDCIIPKQFLKTIKRTGLGVGLFSMAASSVISTFIVAVAWFFYRPLLSSTENFDRWSKNGGADAAERAGRIAQETLDGYEQPPIDDGVRDQLRDYVARRRIELGDEPIPSPAF